MSSIIIIKTKSIGINSVVGKKIIDEIEKFENEYKMTRLNDKKNKDIFVYFNENKINMNYIIDELKKQQGYNSVIEKIYFHDTLKRR